MMTGDANGVPFRRRQNELAVQVHFETLGGVRHSRRLAERLRFLSNGRIDSHDDYAGRWWFESGAIHTQMWEENPSSLVEYLFPKRHEFVFAITRNEKNRPSVMQNTNVVLTHSSSWIQQRTSPSKAVNPSGRWYKFLIPSGRI